MACTESQGEWWWHVYSVNAGQFIGVDYALFFPSFRQGQSKMRSYIRHPSDIPIHVQVESAQQRSERQRLTNVSHGGLAFESEQQIETGIVIQMQIDVVEPGFTAEGVVTHCQREADHYIIGVQFISHDDLFVARMVEQICHIEHYKREVAEREGREISGQQAAKEWIAKYASSFPQW